MASSPVTFERPLLVYVPCRNCEDTVVAVLSGIPRELAAGMECLVVDNCSTDRTAEVLVRAIEQNAFPFRVRLVKTTADLDYPGTQKLAYAIACESPAVRHVIMLHGDGQYAPELLSYLAPYLDGDYAVVNGYRDKARFGAQEETPPRDYLVIKILCVIENLVTGLRQREWASGFVMYAADFLRRIPLDRLSNTRHIDGEFLMCAGALGEKTLAVPIFKRYKDFKPFAGWGRVLYVWHVAQALFRFRRGYYHGILATPHAPTDVSGKYEVLL